MEELLPDEVAPTLEVHQDGRGGWVAETSDGDTERVRDGAVLSAGGSSWRLRLPAVVEGTMALDAHPRLSTAELVLRVSRDEEHVQGVVVHRGKEHPLDSREHWYAILTLARARLRDAALPDAEQGWIDRDELLRMLQTDANGLNVAIYRTRRQLGALGMEDAANIVEVRRGQRRLGIDVARITVEPM